MPAGRTSPSREPSRPDRPSSHRRRSSFSLSSLREELASSLWFIPSLFIAAAVTAALLLARIDRELSETPSGERLQLVFSGGPEAARAVLGTVAGSILTLTALVFSITVLVLQLTSTQFSPRALRTFLRDRTSKVTMGVFLGTFSFALVGLREVRSESAQSPAFVPGAVVTGAFALTLASLYTFLFYIHHVARRIQASSIIASIAEESQGVLERLYPRDGEGVSSSEGATDGLGPPTATLHSPWSNTLVSIDEDDLLQLARRHACCLALRVSIGEFVVTGQPVVDVFGCADIDEGEVFAHLHLGEHRTMEQDLRFGFRQLVDIAVRALSSGTNDPSTAVQVLDRLHDLLTRLGRRQFPSPECFDHDDVRRLVRTPQEWESFVRISVEEIAHYGAEDPQVAKRLRCMYTGLMADLPQPRADVVRRVASQTLWHSSIAKE